MTLVVFDGVFYIFIYSVKLDICVRNSLSDRVALWYAVVIFFTNIVLFLGTMFLG